MRISPGLVVVALSLWPVVAVAETAARASTNPYFDNRTVDLLELLPAPPSVDAVESRTELGELLVVQVTRTADMVARAQADAIEEVWRFADVLGPKFSAEALPRTAAMFERLKATDDAVLEPAKAQFNRQRPYVVSDLVRPVVKPSSTGSWPSSHAALGTLMGIILGDMLPEKRVAILDRARIYAENRLVAGVHYPSDIEMGRIAGTVIAAFALKQPAFVDDYVASRIELRGRSACEAFRLATTPSITQSGHITADERQRNDLHRLHLAR